MSGNCSTFWSALLLSLAVIQASKAQEASITYQDPGVVEAHAASSSTSSSSSSKLASTLSLNDTISTSSNTQSSTTNGRTEPNMAESAASSSSSPLTSSHPPPSPLECGLYLAPSTIPGAGLGMYAGRAYQNRELLQAGDSGDIVIPIVDLRYHQYLYGGADGTSTESPSQFAFLWDEYTWAAENLHMDQEGLRDVNAASPGFGAAANCFLPLLNVDEWNPHPDPLSLHRSVDPGAGAMSLYHNRSATAARDIGAGEELFVSYGEHWFTGREYLGPVPLSNDLETATQLFRKFQTFKDQQEHTIPEDILDDVWITFVQHTAYTDSRVLQSFNHSDPTEVRRMKDRGDNLTSIRIEQATRSMEWLQQNGVCADHIEPQTSSLPQAGKGGFASRFLPQGTIVSHLPLIHIFDRTVMEMYHFRQYENGEEHPDPTLGVRTFQLLLNYCFGHGESSLLLCPYAPMASYVNHNQTQANVKLQWSDRGNHMPDLMNKDLAELAASWTAKLAMDMVALRDIQPGEELFLDYGDEWEAAWQEHLATWEPVEGAEDYVSAAQLNQDREHPLRTEFDALESPIPNAEAWCNNIYLNLQWRKHYDEGTMNEFISSVQSKIYRCDVLRHRVDEADKTTLWYTAVLWQVDTVTGMLQTIGKIVDVPREAIHYYDLPYTTDMHLPNAFRHDIRIPNDMFPSAWRNWAGELHPYYLQDRYVEQFGQEEPQPYSAEYGYDADQQDKEGDEEQEEGEVEDDVDDDDSDPQFHDAAGELDDKEEDTAHQHHIAEDLDEPVSFL